MFSLEYEAELDYDQWGRRLLRLIWLSVVAVFLTELALLLGYSILGEVTNYPEYIRDFILVPTGGCLAVVGVLALASEYLLPRRKFAMQAYVFITGITGLVFLLSFVHNYVLVTQGLFAIPILFALSYVDIKPIIFATGLGLVSYGVFVVCIYHYVAARDYGTVPLLGDIGTNFTIIVVTALIAVMVLRRQTELVTLIHGAQQQTKLDSLTGLYNHGAFYEKLDELIQAHNQDDEPFLLVLLDIDNFKAVNDQYGHDVGDTVLMALVRALRHNGSPQDHLFRYGGEEFAILTTRSEQATLQLAENIRASFSASALLLDNPIDATVSGGVCRYDTERFGGRREFFAAADEALYHA
ncbi:GGDEF domain-containing protein, partial [Ruminococcaceae bacterium OttesenSCG-928-D13]|nr:GGDEF domain-containing protein [Ruminococcaceae bacterium OttesenSCG-928-D13]